MTVTGRSFTVSLWPLLPVLLLRSAAVSRAPLGRSFTVSLWPLLPVLLLRSAAVSRAPLEPEVIGSPALIFCSPGADVVLPCHVDPELDVRDLTVEWSWTERSARPRYVHIYKNRREVSTINRTRLFVEQLGRGNISLKVLNVSEEDGGAYRCFVPQLRSGARNATVRLVVDPNWFRKPTDTLWEEPRAHWEEPGDQGEEPRNQGEEPGVRARSRFPVGVAVSLLVVSVVGLSAAFCVFKFRRKKEKVTDARLRLTLRHTANANAAANG